MLGNSSVDLVRLGDFESKKLGDASIDLIRLGKVKGS